MDEATEKKGLLTRIWRRFWRPSAKFSFGGLLITGGIAGVVFVGGYNTVVGETNTLEFCISCHEMESTVFDEYKYTLHYKNPSGVRVTCADCHVPKEWGPKLLAKVVASKDLYHHFLGTIDTKEKFEKARLTMAERVWAKMERTDSRECRSCHAFDSMAFDEQKRRPRRKHQKAMEEGKTCIACHKGVAHDLPDDYEEDEEESG